MTFTALCYRKDVEHFLIPFFFASRFCFCTLLASSLYLTACAYTEMGKKTMAHHFSIPYFFSSSLSSLQSLFPIWIFQCVIPLVFFLLCNACMSCTNTHTFTHSHRHIHTRWVFDAYSTPCLIVTSAFITRQRDQRERGKGKWGYIYIYFLSLLVDVVESCVSIASKKERKERDGESRARQRRCFCIWSEWRRRECSGKREREQEEDFLISSLKKIPFSLLPAGYIQGNSRAGSIRKGDTGIGDFTLFSCHETRRGERQGRERGMELHRLQSREKERDSNNSRRGAINPIRFPLLLPRVPTLHVCVCMCMCIVPSSSSDLGSISFSRMPCQSNMRRRKRREREREDGAVKRHEWDGGREELH